MLFGSVAWGALKCKKTRYTGLELRSQCVCNVCKGVYDFCASSRQSAKSNGGTSKAGVGAGMPEEMLGGWGSALEMLV